MQTNRILAAVSGFRMKRNSLKYGIMGLIPLIVIFILSIRACSTAYGPEKALRRELDLLKESGSTLLSEVSDDILSPKDASSIPYAEEADDIFPLYFQNFNYRIRDIRVEKGTKRAYAKADLRTMDARSFCRDYRLMEIRERLLYGDTGPVSARRYRIFQSLLTREQYQTMDTEYTICLQETEDGWEIIRTEALENALTGGLISCLSDPMILTAGETLEVSLKTIREMDQEQFCTFLGIGPVLSGSDEEREEIARALCIQAHQFFDYQLVSERREGYQAEIDVQIQSFDYFSILSSYYEAYEKYMNSAQAVIDGEEIRARTCIQLLLKSIQENSAVKDHQVQFHLTNDGEAWKIPDFETVLGETFFGSTSQPDSEEI